MIGFLYWLHHALTNAIVYRACPALDNRKRKDLAQNNIHIFPSDFEVYDDSNGYDFTGVNHRKILPTEMKCADVFLPDKSDKFKICTYDPNQDHVISRHIHVRNKVIFLIGILKAK